MKNHKKRNGLGGSGLGVKRRSIGGSISSGIYWVKRHKIYTAIIAVIVVAVILGVVYYISSVKTSSNKTNQSAVSLEYEKKLPELKQKVHDNPDSSIAHKNYAVALYATGDAQEAKNQYEKAVELNDKDSTAYNNLGNVYRDLNEIDKAINSYKKSIELNPKSTNAYANLANIQLYTQNKPKDAIETYKKALTHLPKDTGIELLLGIAYEQSGDKDTARLTYQNILSYDQDNKAAKASLDRLDK